MSIGRVTIIAIKMVSAPANRRKRKKPCIAINGGRHASAWASEVRVLVSPIEIAFKVVLAGSGCGAGHAPCLDIGRRVGPGRC